jgi:glutamyl-tRNA synthetase
MEVRVRFGPSLKAPLSLGGLRMALFNYIFACSQNGRFILRIEDTDQGRIDREVERDLYRAFAWTGIDYHEGGERGGLRGPYVQSERLPLYRRHAEDLVDQGHAYFCFCSTQRLETIRADQVRSGRRSGYDGACAKLPYLEAKRRVMAGAKHVIRLKIPRQIESILVLDNVFGQIFVPVASLDDQILLKSDSFPTYHLSSVIDDHYMGISHIIRSAVWLSSTPKHLLLYDWFGWEPAQFVHVPPMSGGLSSALVRDFLSRGVPAEALLNLVSTIGWQGVPGKEIPTLREMIASFSLRQLRRTCGSPNEARLKWLSAQHMRHKTEAAIAEAILPFLCERGLPIRTQAYRESVVRLVGTKAWSYDDLVTRYSYFFTDPSSCDRADLIETLPRSEDLILKLYKRLQKLPNFTLDLIESAVRELALTTDVALPALLNYLRLSIFGMIDGPNVFAAMQVLGRNTCERRLLRSIEVLAAPSAGDGNS